MIVVHYRPRGSLAGVWRQYYEYGYWKVPVMLKHRRVLSLRSLAPLACVVGDGNTRPGGKRDFARPRQLVAVETAAYLAAGGAFAVVGLRRRGEPLSLLPKVVATFPMFHFGYGAGMLHGWLRAAAARSSLAGSEPAIRVHEGQYSDVPRCRTTATSRPAASKVPARRDTS